MRKLDTSNISDEAKDVAILVSHEDDTTVEEALVKLCEIGATVYIEKHRDSVGD